MMKCEELPKERQNGGKKGKGEDLYWPKNWRENKKNKKKWNFKNIFKRGTIWGGWKMGCRDLPTTDEIGGRQNG